MHNFLQLVRPSLRYRWTIAGIFVSSLLVGVMWGLNIGALFPVLKVAFEKQPLQEWVAEELTAAQAEIDAAQQELDANAPDMDAYRLESRIKSQEAAIKFYGRMAMVAQFFPRDPFRTIVWIVGALIVGTILKGCFLFCNLMLVARLEQRLAFDLRQSFFHKCLKLDQSTFGAERASGLLSRFHADVGFIAAAVRSMSGTALREPMKIVTCLVGASLISWRLLLLSLIFTPITAYTIRRLAASIKRANRRSLEEISSLYAVLSEAFQGIETVQAFTLERHQRRKFFQVAKTCFLRNMRIALYNAMTKPITEILGICVISLTIVCGAYLTLNETTSIGPITILDHRLDMIKMMTFFAFLVGATEPARKLSDVFNSFQAGTAAADRLVPMLEQESAIMDAADPISIPDGRLSIQFSNVNFSYGDGPSVLSDIELEVAAGETIAIVGPNGCGKTTLINMLPRFHDPVAGAVKLGGVDVRDVRLRELRSRIGMVTQRSLLFDDTVYNNIRHGCLSASQTEIVRAAKAAHADKFIQEKLQDGYETVIGTAGGNLSGGQRQRLALARAMVRNPDILILDEATSQIDIESEQLIHKALQEFAKERTVIMITHRLSTLELADRIVVMDQGLIEDVGMHDELMVRCPLYQRLHELQLKQTG